MKKNKKIKKNLIHEQRRAKLVLLLLPLLLLQLLHGLADLVLLQEKQEVFLLRGSHLIAIGTVHAVAEQFRHRQLGI